MANIVKKSATKKFFSVILCSRMEKKLKLLGMTPEELRETALQAGLPAFAGKQIASWLYQKKVRSISAMTNISKEGRARLEESYEVGVTAPSDCVTARDGTKKYLFPVSCRVGASVEDSFIESVMIPDGDRKTLCVSSQAGCKMGCRFCMTGRQGFHGNLSVADILSQLIGVEESDELTNVVFMGMGEPLDNYDNVLAAIRIMTAPWGFAWSPKRITLSSIGVLPNLERYMADTKCHLAISLHDPFPEERASIMPVQNAWDIRDVVELLKKYDFSGQRRVSFEYTMFAGLNDTRRHAEALVRMLRGLECRVNLIRFHKIPDFEYDTASDRIMEYFKGILEKAGLTATIRASRGEDIFAACGMLAGKNSGNGR